jgi:hypothetical protein
MPTKSAEDPTNMETAQLRSVVILYFFPSGSSGLLARAHASRP